MKNLKKVLALVLAVATLMGLATVSSAAFTDASSIEYKEAAEVLTLVKVIEGNPDGSFNPTGDVTRAQMAKMISVIMNSGKDINDLYTSANTFSDCNGHWGAGYIAYAASTGLVVGKGDNKFDPNGKVKGTEAAKMLLGALGYKAEFQGYSGTNWASAVLRDAQKAGLTKSLSSVNLGANLSREQAAQMIFNALKADMVEYDNAGSTVTLPDGTTVTSGASSPKKVEYKVRHYEDGVDNDQVKQLCEEYYGEDDGKLTLKTVGGDDFDRPASKWTFDKDDVTVSKSTDYTLTGEVKVKAIYEKIGKDQAKLCNAVVYVDGVKQKDAITKYDSNDLSKTLSNKNESVVAGTGVGSVVEVFVDDSEDAPYTKIVVINSYVGTVSSVKAAKDDVERTITIKGETGTGLEGGTYETEGFDKDDVVIYTKANGEIKSVEAAQVVTGTLSKVSGNTYTIGGTDYKTCKAYRSIVSNDIDASSNLNKEVSVYVDTQGNLIKVKEAETSTEYVYVVANSKAVEASDFTSDSDETVDIYGVLSDGSIVTKTTYVKEALAALKTAGKLDSNNGIPQGIYTYSEDSDGVWTLKEAVDVAGYVNGTSASINIGATSVNGSILNSDTIFVFMKNKDNDADSKVVETTTVKTGSSNIGSSINDKVYVATDEGVAKVVFVKADYDDGSSDTGKLVYFDDEKGTEVKEYNNTYYTFSGTTQDGDDETFTMSKKPNDDCKLNGIYKYNDDMTVGDAVKAANVVSGKIITISGSTIKIDTTPADTEDNEFKYLTLTSDSAEVFLDSDTALAENQTIVCATSTADNKGNEIVAIFVTVDAP